MEMRDGEVRKMESTWYIPGPTDVRAEVLDAMAEPPYGHRTGLMKLPLLTVQTGLLAICNADPESHHVVVAPGSGTYGLEMATRNLAQPSNEFDEETVLTTGIGLFGDLWSNIFAANGVHSTHLRNPDGKAIQPEQIEQRIRAYPSTNLVTVTHNDTSVGAQNDLESIGEAIRKSDGEVLFAVDAVSSAGSTEINVDRDGIDWLVMAPQKGLGVPPGLVALIISDRALERANTATNPGYVTDIHRHVEAMEQGTTLTTPPLAQIGALALQMDYILRDEGLEHRYIRHKALAHRTHQWVEEEGFELLPDKKDASDSVTCVVNTRGVKLKSLQEYMWTELGYGFDAGHPKLAVIRQEQGLPETFRIAHMGDRTFKDFGEYLSMLSVSMESYS